MSADQKLDALALVCFERNQGRNLKLQIEPPATRERNMTTVERLSCITSELEYKFGEVTLFIPNKLDALELE